MLSFSGCFFNARRKLQTVSKPKSDNDILTDYMKECGMDHTHTSLRANMLNTDSYRLYLSSVRFKESMNDTVLMRRAEFLNMIG